MIGDKPTTEHVYNKSWNYSKELSENNFINMVIIEGVDLSEGLCGWAPSALRACLKGGYGVPLKR